MVGASDADFKRVSPLFDAMGTTTYHCGDVGTGGRTKLVNNYVAITLCQVNGEALALSQKFGLDITKTMQVLLGTSANNGQLRMNFPNKVLAGDTSPGFTIDLAHKDLRSEEHTSELQSLMRISYAVFCLKKQNKHKYYKYNITP